MTDMKYGIHTQQQRQQQAQGQQASGPFVRV